MGHHENYFLPQMAADIHITFHSLCVFRHDINKKWQSPISKLTMNEKWPPGNVPDFFIASDFACTCTCG